MIITTKVFWSEPHSTIPAGQRTGDGGGFRISVVVFSSCTNKDERGACEKASKVNCVIQIWTVFSSRIDDYTFNPKSAIWMKDLFIELIY